MRVVYFKASMLINFRKEVDLKSELKKIIEESEDFSLNSAGKFIEILEVYESSITFAIRIVADKGYEKFSLRAIIPFLRKLCEIFSVEYNNKYFKVDESQSIYREDYLELQYQAFSYKKSVLEKLEEQSSSSLDIEIPELLNHTDTFNLSNDIKDIKIPKRTFPSLLRGALSIFKSTQSPIEYNTLKETLSALDSLIGMEDVKAQIKNLASFIMRNNERYVNYNIENPGLYYNAAIFGGKGSGKTTLAKILCHIYYHLGVIGKGKFINIDCNTIWAGYKMEGLIGDAQSGVIILDNAHNVSFDKRGKADITSTFNDWFSTYKNNFVFLLVGEEGGIEKLLKDKNLSRKINCKINIPELSNDDSLCLLKKYAKAEKLTIDNSVLPDLSDCINYLKEKKLFENSYTAKSILEKAVFKNGAVSNILSINDFEFQKDEVEVIEEIHVDPLDELDKMIGLNIVKEKVKEIAAYAKAQLLRKELGLKTGPICLHTCFTGNPGTGKTTVARLLGKVFKEIGVLATDKFTEVSRQDLVGAYVGHTALKTESKVNEALGGVLFIDEAYSMKSESRIDFGYEAVATLIKMMEDLRDNIVVIFAGYTDEMEEFINMNPGLRDRVQFKLNFDDYNSDELVEIWLKFFKDEQYIVDNEAYAEMVKITNKLSYSRSSNFSNGRIIRKCFERVKMYQSVRIIKEVASTADDIMKIKAEDIKTLYSDKDLNEELHKTNLRRCIGFSSM